MATAAVEIEKVCATRSFHSLGPIGYLSSTQIIKEGYLVKQGAKFKV
jgi:hypothetical protein